MREILGYLDGYKTYIGFVVSGAIVVAASAGWIDWHQAGVLGGVAGAWTGVSLRQAIAKAHEAADYVAEQVDQLADLTDEAKLNAASALTATHQLHNAFDQFLTDDEQPSEPTGANQNGVPQHPLSEKVTGPQG